MMFIIIQLFKEVEMLNVYLIILFMFVQQNIVESFHIPRYVELIVFWTIIQFIFYISH